MTITIPPGNLDPVLQANRWPGTTFILQPGVHYTDGHVAFDDLDSCMIPPGCTLQGSGDGRTEIQLCDGVGYREVLTGGARSAKTDTPAVIVRDVVIDCGDWKGTKIGLHLWGTGCRVERVRVLRVRGDRNDPHPNEGFGILINDGYSQDGEAGTDGGHVVEDCVVKASGYSTACYVGCLRRPGRSLLRSHVRRVQCIGSNGAHAAFAANADTTLEDCTAESFVRGLFMDTDSVHAVQVRGCHFKAIQWGVEVRTEKPGAVVDGIRFCDCRFEFQANEWAQPVLSVNAAGSGSSIQGIRFHECQLLQAGKFASAGRYQGPNVETASFLNCEWRGPWQAHIVQP